MDKVVEKKNNSFEEIFGFLKSAKKVLMSLHFGPDGDSLGSCAAMKYFLERDFGVEVTLVSKDDLDSTLSESSFSKEVKFGEGIDGYNWDEFDLVITLDSGSIKQFSEKTDLDFSKVVNIDHHATNEFHGRLNYVEILPSCCSVLLKFFREIGVRLDSELSTRLLLGLYTDSGGFSHDNGVSVREAAFLVENGARYLEIVNLIKYGTPLRIKKYFALVVDKFRVVDFEGCKVGVSVVSKSDIDGLNLNLSEARGAINYLQEIGGLDFLFTLADTGDFIKGSFRSRKGVDVSLFAQALGGGGHKAAAAFKLQGISLEDAEKKVFDVIKEVGVHHAEIPEKTVA